jgi:aspartyl-tRNA(Asn)/glutamyl-tRNA(Gln) amidotransferase subunit A
MELHELSIQEAHDLLSSRKISSEELTRAYLERIQRLDPQVNRMSLFQRNLQSNKRGMQTNASRLAKA